MAFLQFVIVVFLSTTVLSDNPTVKIYSTDPPVDPVEGVIIQQKGKDVQLTCVVENKPENTEVQWTVQDVNNGGNTIQIATATRSYDAFKWAIDTPSSTSWRLRIQNAQISSEGVYTCKVEVASTTAPVQDTRQLRVVQKPEIEDLTTSTDMLRDSGDPATLECYAMGHPPPIVTWTRLAGELLPSGGTALQSNVLFISEIEHDHAGVYKCTATNSAGSDERRILVTVQFPPIVVATEPLVLQKVGYVKQLVCNIKGYPLPEDSQIAWRRDNQPIVPNSRLQIRNIPGAYNRITSILDVRGVKSSDYGRYICSANNQLGSREAVVELQTSVDPTTDRSNRVVAGSSVTTFNLGLTVLTLLSVWLIHVFRIH